MYQTAPCANITATRASSTILRLRHWPKASAKGALEAVPSAFILAKAGLSDSFSRIQIEIASSPAETRNGIRQPHWSKASGPKNFPRTTRVTRITVSAPNRPSAAEVCTQPVARPRPSAGACSAT